METLDSGLHVELTPTSPQTPFTVEHTKADDTGPRAGRHMLPYDKKCSGTAWGL